MHRRILDNDITIQITVRDTTVQYIEQDMTMNEGIELLAVQIKKGKSKLFRLNHLRQD